MGKIDKVTEDGNFTCQIALTINGPDLDRESAKLLGVQDFIIEGNRIHWHPMDFDEEQMGAVSDIQINEIHLPEGVSDFFLELSDWEPVYLDGDGLEIVGIYATGKCVSTIDVPAELHDADCSGVEGECDPDCGFNEAWWKMNEKRWDDFYVYLTHKGFPGVTFTGWMKEPPEIN